MKRTIVCLAFVAAACGDNGSPLGPSSDGVRIAGRVLEFRTGAAVVNARIALGATQTTSDAQGNYELIVPNLGRYQVSVNSIFVGSIMATPSSSRGDVFVDASGCISRYGMVVDARSLKPIAGATVTLLGSTRTGPDGWYRLDMGCTPNGLFNTVFMSIEQPGYERFTVVAGRGVQGVSRVDVALQRDALAGRR